MKPIIYLLLALGVLTSCQTNTLTPFEEEKSSIYFREFSKNVFLINHSFVFFKGDTAVYNVSINITGMPTAKDRTFKLVADTASTAKIAIDYEALKETYTIPAGTYTVNVPIKIYRSASTKTKQLKIILKLEENNDFSLIRTASPIFSIVFSDFLTKPVNWSDFDYRAYSQVKHRIFLELTKRTEYPTDAEITAQNAYFRYVVPLELKNHFEKMFNDGKPVYDENGVMLRAW